MDKRAAIQTAIELIQREAKYLHEEYCDPSMGSSTDVCKNECCADRMEARSALWELQAELESFQPPMHTISG